MLAERAEAIAALTKIFLREVEQLVRKAAGLTPTPDRPLAPRIDGVYFLHRFGSALNRHVHLHACVTDGVFSDNDGEQTEPRVTFLPARPITSGDVDPLTSRVRKRLIRWFTPAMLLATGSRSTCSHGNADFR